MVNMRHSGCFPYAYYNEVYNDGLLTHSAQHSAREIVTFFTCTDDAPKGYGIFVTIVTVNSLLWK